MARTRVSVLHKRERQLAAPRRELTAEALRRESSSPVTDPQASKKPIMAMPQMAMAIAPYCRTVSFSFRKIRERITENRQ